MSLSKSVPEGLNPRECKRTKLCEPLPVPYIPEKDKVQEDQAMPATGQDFPGEEHPPQLSFMAEEWDP